MALNPDLLDTLSFPGFDLMNLRVEKDLASKGKKSVDDYIKYKKQKWKGAFKLCNKCITHKGKKKKARNNIKIPVVMQKNNKQCHPCVNVVQPSSKTATTTSTTDTTVNPISLDSPPVTSSKNNNKKEEEESTVVFKIVNKMRKQIQI